MTAPALPPLNSLTDQADRLVALGVTTLAGLDPAAVRDAVAAFDPVPGALLVLRPDVAPVSALAPLLRHRDKPGFVVTDMTDVDAFVPTESCQPPESALYVVTDVDRGDEMANWSPEEALPAITAAGRTPLTLSEGVHWLLQQPEALAPHHCFMTIGSRLPKPNGSFDARTPALWISGGTGRDGAERRHAPKVGWCWWRNRHTWLGFASATGRVPGP